MAENIGMVYVFGIVGQDIVKYGMVNTATSESLLKRKKELENLLSQTQGPQELELLAAIFSPNPRVQEQTILSFFGDDTFGGAEKVNRFAFFKAKNAAKEFRRKSINAINWINELRKLPFVITSMEEVSLDDCRVIHGYEEWGPEHLICKSVNDGAIQFPTIRPISADTDGDLYTEEVVTNMARRVMGSIDLDPASSRKAQFGDPFFNEGGVRANEWYDVHDDGLIQPWHGNVWLNPPFGKWHIWCKKIVREIDLGHLSQIMVLAGGPAITGGSGFFDTDFIYRMALCVPYGRLQFWGAKNHTDSAGWSAVLFYFGTNLDKFKKELAPYGVVYDPPTKITTATKTLSKKNVNCWSESELPDWLGDRSEAPSL